MPSETETASRADDGCAFILEGAAAGGPSTIYCNAPRRPGSPYCPAHHERCHLPGGGADERRQLREIEALAEAVGGKQGRPATRPPRALLRRLERLAQLAARPSRSCIVPEEP